MKAKTFFVFLLMFLYFQCKCQYTFEKLYAGGSTAYGVSVIELSDTSFAVLCGTESSLIPFGHDFVRITINSFGDSLWSNNYCGVDPKKIILLKDSTIAIASNRTGYCPNGANSDLLLVKTKFNGDTLWEHIYGYSNPEYVQGMDTIKNGFVLLSDNIGTFPSFFKTDTAGNFISSGYGYTYMQAPHAIKATLDGGYIVVGWYGSVPNCWAVEKFDSTGSYQWEADLGNSSSQTIDDQFRDVIQLPDSDYIVSGSAPLSLVKINHINGDTIWTRNYGADVNSIAYTPDHNIIAVDGSANIFKCNTSGVQLWSRHFPNAYLNSITPTSDVGFIGCGAYSTNGVTSSVVVIKTDSLGNVSSLIGIDENNISQNNSNVFPNPLTNISQLNFLNLKNELYHFSITDITGRISEEKETRGSSIYIEKGNKPEGVYFYSLTNKSTGEMLNGKFVVE